MKKRFLCIFLTAALAISLFAGYAPTAGAGLDTTTGFGTNLAWSLDTNSGTLTIRLYPGSSASSGSMPNYMSSVGAPWYNYRARIRNVVISGNVTNIGNYAFNDCMNLETVSIQSTVMTTVGQYAFSGCGLIDNITLPNSVTAIGQYAFSGCAEMKSIVLPANVSTIETGAFNGCMNLTGMSFNGALSNSRFEIDPAAGVLLERSTAAPYLPARLIKAPRGLAQYLIPGTVTVIDPEAFAHSNLRTITIPAGVDNIGLNAFSWCVKLEEVIFLGSAPQIIPSGTQGLFDNAAPGFTVYYYPYTYRWPSPPSINWRGYKALAMSSYVTVTPSVTSLEKGKTIQLSAAVYPANADQNVTWSVVQEVPAGGQVVDVPITDGIVRAGNNTGWVDIVARSLLPDGTYIVSAPARVYVVENSVPVTGLILDKNQVTTSIGGDAQILAAVIYPLDATNKELIWTSSNTNVAYADVIPTALLPGVPGGGVPTPPLLQRLIVPVGPGTTTITVTTADNRFSASCVVTVTSAPVFVPVSNISLSTLTLASGATIDLDEISTLMPANATRDVIVWKIITQTTEGVMLDGSKLYAPFGQLGSVVVEAAVRHGLAEQNSGPPDNIDWGYPEDIDYIKRFVISVVAFVPVSEIVELPGSAFAGIPLQLKGTVLPLSASYQDIEWKILSTTAGALPIDPKAGLLTTQWPGTVVLEASIKNGRLSADGTPTVYTQHFAIRVDQYVTNTIEIRANPGGVVSPSGSKLLAAGEEIRLTATASQGYVFSGWNSTNGGVFDNANSTTTTFTVPANTTIVTAYFAFVGLPAGGAGGGGGGVVIPTPVHYFTNGSVYMKNSDVSFGHVTIRDFQLFSRVTLNGKQLSRNAHYTAERLNGYTAITLVNGYLDSLNQGSHTLTIHFTDYTSVTAVFSVIETSYVSHEYDDVYSSDWYYYGVQFVSTRGWMGSKSSDAARFRPNDAITQGETIETLHRMAGDPSVVNQYGQPLQGRDAAYEWVRQNGILPISGAYSLDSAITRQDIAVLLSKLAGVMRLKYPVVRDAPGFADEWQINDAARVPVKDMYRAGVINGRTESTFVPLGNMTRGEAAVLFQRFAEAIGAWG